MLKYLIKNILPISWIKSDSPAANNKKGEQQMNQSSNSMQNKAGRDITINMMPFFNQNPRHRQKAQKEIKYILSQESASLNIIPDITHIGMNAPHKHKDLERIVNQKKELIQRKFDDLAVYYPSQTTEPEAICQDMLQAIDAFKETKDESKFRKTLISLSKRFNDLCQP